MQIFTATLTPTPINLRISLLAEVTKHPSNPRLQGPALRSCGFETRLRWTWERLFARDHFMQILTRILS